MKRFIITENERKNILKSHSLLKEQDENNLSATDMLDKIQKSLNTKNDVIIGPETTNKIVSTLKQIPTTKFDYSCVVNHPNVEVVERIDGTNEYQIGELLFQRNGTYFDLNEPNKPLTYTCSGTTIQTSNHDNIMVTTEVKPTKTEDINKLINQFKTMQQPNDTIISLLKEKGYTDEDIKTADPTLLSSSNEPNVKQPIQQTNEIPADENDIFARVMDKTGTRPINPINLKP